MLDKITLSLTGHRPTKLAGYNLNQPYYYQLQETLENYIRQALKYAEVVECHSGMALGADTVWAQAIIQCKDMYPNRVTFVADIPDYNQASRWPQVSQTHWQRLMEDVDQVNTYIEGNEDKSYAYVLNQRNFGMLDACDILIAVYNGDETGGTANAVKYAIQKNKKIEYVRV